MTGPYCKETEKKSNFKDKNKRHILEKTGSMTMFMMLQRVVLWALKLQLLQVQNCIGAMVLCSYF